MPTFISDLFAQGADLYARIHPSVLSVAERVYELTGAMLLLLLSVFAAWFGGLALRNLLISVRTNFEDEPFYTLCTLLLFLFVLSGLIVSVHEV